MKCHKTDMRAIGANLGILHIGWKKKTEDKCKVNIVIIQYEE